MQNVGNDEAGFSVDYDGATTTLNVRAWGFWGIDVARTFGPAVKDACRTCPKGATLVIDMTDLKPMRDEGQDSFRMLVTALPSLGMAKATVATASQLTKLQLLRITTECGRKGLIQFK